MLPPDGADPAVPAGLSSPPGTTELGIDIIKVDRIAGTLERSSASASRGGS